MSNVKDLMELYSILATIKWVAEGIEKNGEKPYRNKQCGYLLNRLKGALKKIECRPTH